MERMEPSRQLHDAVDLLVMLEHLVDGIVSSRERGEGVPWPGIRLTLTQARELVASAIKRPEDRVSERSPDRGMSRAAQLPAPNERPLSRNDSAAGGIPQMSIADRVQPAPTGVGRVRDLGGNEAAHRSEAGGRIENGGRGGRGRGTNPPPPLPETAEH